MALFTLHETGIRGCYRKQAWHNRKQWLLVPVSVSEKCDHFYTNIYQNPLIPFPVPIPLHCEYTINPPAETYAIPKVTIDNVQKCSTKSNIQNMQNKVRRIRAVENICQKCETRKVTSTMQWSAGRGCQQWSNSQKVYNGQICRQIHVRRVKPAGNPYQKGATCRQIPVRRGGTCRQIPVRRVQPAGKSLSEGCNLQANPYQKVRACRLPLSEGWNLQITLVSHHGSQQQKNQCSTWSDKQCFLYTFVQWMFCFKPSSP